MTRYAFVDIAKGFAITAIVLWHITFSFDSLPLFPVKTILGGLWHVPAFFIISGFFLKDEKIFEPIPFIRGKIKTLYLWTLCFYVPAVLLHNFFIEIGFYSEALTYGGKIMQSYTAGDFIKNCLAAVFFAGREPIVAPLWYAYVLCLALFCFVFISIVCKKIWGTNYKEMRLLGCILLATISAILSNKLGLTINRFSNTLVALLLLALGQYLFQEKKIQFKSVPLFIGSIALFWQSAVLSGNTALNGNQYHDLFHLVCGSSCMLYAICFISKKMESNIFGRVMEYIGKKSFYIMALHVLAFRLLSLLLFQFGFDTPYNVNGPKTDNNIVMILAFLIWGVSLPMLFAYAWTALKEKIF